jgi:5'-3' exonuclease
MAALPENPTTADRNALLAACKKAVGRPLWFEQGLCDFLSTASCPGFEVTWEVALFEADAQIALLFSMKLFDFVLCEDQDLLVYGVDLMVAGWSPTTGTCVVTDLRPPTTFPLRWCTGAACAGLVGKKKRCTECSAGAGLTRIQVRDACLLTGTDYWVGPPGVGIVKACKLVLKHGNNCTFLSQRTHTFCSS